MLDKYKWKEHNSKYLILVGKQEPQYGLWILLVVLSESPIINMAHSHDIQLLHHMKFQLMQPTMQINH